jgi:hypothetical protein
MLKRDVMTLLHSSSPSNNLGFSESVETGDESSSELVKSPPSAESETRVDFSGVEYSRVLRRNGD